MTGEEWENLSLADRIRLLLDEQHLTQDQLALEIGAPRETVNAWANGRRRPSLAFQRKLAELSGWPLEAFRPASPTTQTERRLLEATESLSIAAQGIAATLEQLQPLLEAQEAVVGRLETLLAKLERISTARRRG